MYKYENLNPKKKRTCDCVVRAIAKATNMPYKYILNLLFNESSKSGYFLSDRKCAEYVMTEHLGFKKISCKVKAGEKRPKVSDIAKLTEGNKKRIVCSIATHYTSVADGNIYDIWDCSDKCVYTYFVRED